MGADVVPIAGRQLLTDPEDVWEIALGAGLRAIVDALDDEECEAVHTAVIDGLRRAGVREATIDVVVATATQVSS